MAGSDSKPTILITGSSGLIGDRLIDVLVNDYRLAGLDVVPPKKERPGVFWKKCDLTDDQSVQDALQAVRNECGGHIASVLHLAAYYDFSGEPSEMYEKLTVDGTWRLLRGLQSFDVEQFVFSSTLLVMESSDDDQPVSEASPLDAEWDYPQSKLRAEAVIREERGPIPAVILRIAGVYDEGCHSLPIAQQISRIHQKQLESYLFPGDTSHGQSFVHLDDLVEAFHRTIRHRADLGDYEMLLIGEEDVMSYDELQDTIGELLHGKEWPTIRIPKTVAKAGAWTKDKLARSEEEAPFIKPWMIDLADQNYPVSIKRARTLLGWQPEHALRRTLPEMIARLKQDPKGWYEQNDLPVPDDVKEKL